jgi:hypothetical protein
MRSDMAKVIVERPRIRPHSRRKGRRPSWEDMPSHEGMRRPHVLRGIDKELNENLAPLRRYLERQVGRPWRKVYSEIAQHLRIDSAIQQHVRDHLHDFVVVKPRHVHGGWRSGRIWWQPLYVDPVTDLLCRTDRRSEEKARRRAERTRPSPLVERIALAEDRELRLIAGVWYQVRLAPLPQPAYRVQLEVHRRFRNGWSARGGVDDIELAVRRLASPKVHDVATGQWIAAGPYIDDQASWARYRRDYPQRRYAVTKRALSRRELRRHGLSNLPPPDP